MKRLLLACWLLVALAAPALADTPRVDRGLERPVVRMSLSGLSFPADAVATSEASVAPYVRARLTVAGEGWGFTLVERRWGWELESAICPGETERALALASLDYLNGQAQALAIFVDVPAEYAETLAGLLPG